MQKENVDSMFKNYQAFQDIKTGHKTKCRVLLRTDSWALYRSRAHEASYIKLPSCALTDEALATKSRRQSKVHSKESPREVKPSSSGIQVLPQAAVWKGQATLSSSHLRQRTQVESPCDIHQEGEEPQRKSRMSQCTCEDVSPSFCLERQVGIPVNSSERY
jgi:hypothetical protein